jgi:hypothetical protein
MTHVSADGRGGEVSQVKRQKKTLGHYHTYIFPFTRETSESNETVIHQKVSCIEEGRAASKSPH